MGAHRDRRPGGHPRRARDLRRALTAALAAAGGHQYVVFRTGPRRSPASAGTVHVPLASPYHQAVWDHWRLPGAPRRAPRRPLPRTKTCLPGAAAARRGDGARPRRLRRPETFARAQRCTPPPPRAARLAAAACVITPSEHARADVLGRFGRPPSAWPPSRSASRPPSAARRLRRGRAAPRSPRPRAAARRLHRHRAAPEARRARDRGVRARGRGRRAWQLALAGGSGPATRRRGSSRCRPASLARAAAGARAGVPSTRRRDRRQRVGVEGFFG